MFRSTETGATAMPHDWWTRKYIVLAAAVALALIGCVVVGVSYPEPAASAALGPDWQCNRLAFVFTTCSRARQSQSAPIHLAKIPACARLRT
jgi:hypothetical protein